MIVAVDLTPLRTDGSNGGILPLTMTMLEGMAHWEGYRFVLLTAEWNHEYLQRFEELGFRRWGILGSTQFLASADLPVDWQTEVRTPVKEMQTPEAAEPLGETETETVPASAEIPVSATMNAGTPKLSMKRRCYLKVKHLLAQICPEGIINFLNNHMTFTSGVRRILIHPVHELVRPAIKWIVPHGLLRKWRNRKASEGAAPAENVLLQTTAPVDEASAQTGMLRSHGIELLYCPFTASTYAEPGVACVSVLHDIQHVCYPGFFAPQELENRKKLYKHLCQTATFIISDSDYSKQHFCETYGFPPVRVVNVLLALQDRLKKFTEEETAQEMRTVEIGDEFIFYPANLWLHKNHKVLLTAFGMYRHAHPESKMHLVLTGFGGEAQTSLLADAECMGLSDSIHMLGYVSEKMLAALFRNCRALVFPSLFEGFGIPVVEAMMSGCPVICSNLTSLPEVMLDGALYCDPKNPDSIVEQLEILDTNPELVREKIARYPELLKRFDFETSLQSYKDVFEKAYETVSANKGGNQEC